MCTCTLSFLNKIDDYFYNIEDILIKMSRRPSFLEELRDPITGRIIPLKSRPSPSGGGGAMVVSAPDVEGPTVLSSVLEHVEEWSPARSGPPYFSPPGSPEEKTPAERIRPKESPSLQPQPCLERAALLVAMGFPAEEEGAEEEGLVPPPTIQRRLVFPKGLQRFPPPEEESEEISPPPKRYRVSTD